jgi:protein-disulfide isomerase
LDTGTFNQCLDSGKYTSLIQQMTSMGSSIGVGSTPSFAINGKKVVGAQDYQVFQQIIDSQLNK